MLRHLISFFYLSLLSTSLFAVHDTIIPPENSFGIEAEYSFLRNRIAGNKGSTKERIGNGFQLSVFHEQKTLERLRSSLGIRGRYNTYEREVSRSSSKETRDTVFLNRFLLDRQEVILSVPVIFRFDYVLNPKIYFLLGISPEFRLFEKEEYDYLSTNIRLTNSDFSREIVMSNFEQASTIKTVRYNLGIEIGIGIEVKKTAFEVVLGNQWLLGVGTLSFRLRQKISRKG